MMMTSYQQDLVKIANSISSIGKNQSSFGGFIKFVLQKGHHQFHFNILEATFEKLRERDFDTCNKVFNNQQAVISLLKVCSTIESIALVLKQKHLFMEADTYDYGKSILEALYLQIKLIRTKSKAYDLYMVVPIDDFALTKKNDSSKICNKITPDLKLAYETRIFLMIEYVVFPLVEFYTSDQSQSIYEEFRVVIKWLLFVSHHQEANKLVLITKLTKKILTKICHPMSSVNPNLLYCFNVIMRVFALPLYDQEIIKPVMNVGLFFVDLPEIVIEKLYLEWKKTIKPGDLPKNAQENMVNNLLDCMAQHQSLRIIQCLSKQLRNNRNFEVLQRIYINCIKKKMVQKMFFSPSSFKLAIDIILYYIVGFINTDRIGPQLQVLAVNYKNTVQQIHFQQIMKDSHQLVSISLNMLCFKQTSLKPLIFLLSLCQYRFKSLTAVTQNILRQMKFKYEIEIDFYDIEKHIKNNMFDIHVQNLDSSQIMIPSSRYKGMQNIGNTCYMNSFIQVLFLTTRFHEIIASIGNPVNQEQANRPCFILSQLFKDLEIKGNNRDPIAPYKFKKFLMERFSMTKDQQDSIEFGRLYLEYLLKDFQNTVFKERLQNLFFNKIISQFQCRVCHTKNNKQQKILDFNLSFPSDSKQPQFVSSLFKNYFITQFLDENNKLFCNRCKVNQFIATTTFPKRFSTILLLTINRFLYDTKQNKKIKVLNQVSLQLQIDIKNITPSAPNNKYTLEAFIVHIGSSAEAGHYVAYARNIEQNPFLWYTFDDGYVTQREVLDIRDFNLGQFQTPYILFYNSQKSLMSSIRSLRGSQSSQLNMSRLSIT